MKSNAIIERMHQLLGKLLVTYNLQETYVDDSDPRIGILAAALPLQYNPRTTRIKSRFHSIYFSG